MKAASSVLLQRLSFSAVSPLELCFCKYVAVRDRMYLGVQDFDFSQI